VVAELWWTSSDGERWSTWVSTRGSSWWCRFYSVRARGGESRRRPVRTPAALLGGRLGSAATRCAGEEVGLGRVRGDPNSA
jgi:hypothetical protein